ncbi:unnamed protein product [Linum trigynum]|uniref:Uncharacterized protein n=1 Tax=Linum trigynum TaxID=586398 RepID=A0AAV2FKQ0_9ROSI
MRSSEEEDKTKEQQEDDVVGGFYSRRLHSSEPVSCLLPTSQLRIIEDDALAMRKIEKREMAKGGSRG